MFIPFPTAFAIYLLTSIAHTHIFRRALYS